MTRTKPKYSNKAVDRSGDIVSGRIESNDIEKEEAFKIIDNWRSSHIFPLESFQSLLHKRAKEIDPNAIVVQRLKRLASIIKKLERFRSTNLHTMQDIGGCRVIMTNSSQVDTLVELYRNNDNLNHKFVKEYDYIRNPKPDGYRGVHLVYKYFDNMENAYDSLSIEIQVRTRLQHAWATAVETVGAFTKQSFKSDQGDKDWLRFFALMGSAIAVKEDRPRVPKTGFSLYDFKDELTFYAKSLNVENRLKAYRDSFSVPDMQNNPDQHYYLLELDMNGSENSITVTPYRLNRFEEASSHYINLERDNLRKNVDIVLVSAESILSLRDAYPNYYLDTDLFLQELKHVIE